MAEYNPVPEQSALARKLADFAARPSGIDASILRDWEPPRIPTQAEVAFESLTKQIRHFESRLDDQHEVGVWLIGFASQVLQVDTVGFRDGNLIVFQGVGPEGLMEIIQHVSQLSFILKVVKKQPNKPARRIGFVRYDDDDATE